MDTPRTAGRVDVPKIPEKNPLSHITISPRAVPPVRVGPIYYPVAGWLRGYRLTTLQPGPTLLNSTAPGYRGLPAFSLSISACCASIVSTKTRIILTPTGPLVDHVTTPVAFFAWLSVF